MESTPRLGVLTQTIVRSPVIKFILHARIRDQRYNDVVFVGNDFIHVKQVEHGGRLQHIATKCDFGAHIRAARTFSVQTDALEADDLVKTENGSAHAEEKPTPPQLLVVTLDSDDLMFLYLAQDSQGTLRFVHQRIPLPTYDSMLLQTGVHLAVDPFSRAVAAGANEGDVHVFTAKTKDQIRNELQQDHGDWNPVNGRRNFAIKGVIMHMEFLIPPDADQDHVILLLIVSDSRKIKAMWLDWFFTSGIGHAQHRPNQPIDSTKSAPTMLIPLKEAAFMLASGSDLRLYRNILSGSPTCIQPQGFEPESSYPGSSQRAPLWVSWCRPRRTRAAQQEQDILYLIREDGRLYLVHISGGSTRFVWSSAGDAECHVGAAFASLGDERDPDILAIVGDMSNGKVVSIGAWPTIGRIYESTRADTMTMQKVEALPNWASATDMLVSSLPHGQSARTLDAVFITSGRQPHGTITELRKGLEARLSTYLELGDLHSVLDVWVLPNRSTGSVLILMSTPSSTRLLDCDFENAEAMFELQSDDVNSLDLTERTLAADILSDGYLVQITEHAVSVSASIDAGFEDHSRWTVENGSTIIAAAVEPVPVTAIIVRRTGCEFRMLALKHTVEQGCAIPDGEEEGLQVVGDGIALQDEPICVATTLMKLGILCVVATVSGTLQLVLVDASADLAIKSLGTIQLGTEIHSLCDSAVLLHPEPASDITGSKLLAVFGLRDGKILSMEIDCVDEPTFGQAHEIAFGRSTVRLDRHSSDQSLAHAISGRDVCTMSWDGQAAGSLVIQNIWVTDKGRPNFAQDMIMAVSKMPSDEYCGDPELAGSLVLASSLELLVASVSASITTVPRQISVSGTPTRLIYCEKQRSLVCASICYSVRAFPSNMPHGKPEERRQIWPAIDFIPSQGSSPSFTFHYQPGDRIYGLAEWSFNHGGKQYSFLLVAGSYISRSGQTKGRISMLQPSISDWKVCDVREGRNYTFEKIVYALALYDQLTYVACVGASVLASRYCPDERKWQEICLPFRLPSLGVRISVSGCLVHVSTQKDSLVALKLVRLEALSEADYEYELVAFASASCLAPSQSHVVKPLPSAGAGEQPPVSELAVVSTKDGRILGMTSPTTATKDAGNPACKPRMIFEAQLPCSLTCLRQGNTIPSWHPAAPLGVLSNDILGVAADGGLIRISVLDEGLWRRLFWLQRICEWSERFSPHLVESANYAVEDLEGRERGFPIGFSIGTRDDIALFAAIDCEGTQGDMHIDGDVLRRVLDKGGLEMLQAVIREMAQRNDRIGKWVKEHFDAELKSARGIIDELRALLGSSP